MRNFIWLKEVDFLRVGFIEDRMIIYLNVVRKNLIYKVMGGFELILELIN